MIRMARALIRAMPDQTPTNDKLLWKKFLFSKTQLQQVNCLLTYEYKNSVDKH